MVVATSFDPASQTIPCQGLGASLWRSMRSRSERIERQQESPAPNIGSGGKGWRIQFRQVVAYSAASGRKIMCGGGAGALLVPKLQLNGASGLPARSVIALLSVTT